MNENESNVVSVAGVVAASAVPLGVSGVILRNFIEAEAQAEDSGASKRMASLLARFEQSSTDDVRTATKAMHEDEKDPKAKRIWEVRASEIRQVYGAYRFCKADFSKCGFWKAVEQASGKAGILRLAGVRWDGSKVKTKEEKQSEREIKDALAKTEAGLREAHRIKNTQGREATEDEIRAAVEGSVAAKAAEWARDHAKAILKMENGRSKAEALIEALQDAIYGEQQGAEVLSQAEAA